MQADDYDRVRRTVRVSGLTGYYLVEATLPNGAVISDRCTARKAPGTLWINAFLARHGITNN